MKPKKERAKVQEVKNAAGKVVAYRIQFVDPLDVTGQTRVSIRGKTAAEVIHRAEEAKRRRRDLQAGIISDAGARAAIESVVRGGPMTVKQCFDIYLQKVFKRTKRIAKIQWRYRLAPFWESKSVVDLTAANLGEWYRLESEAGCADSTIKNAWELLRAAVNLQVRGRKIAEPAWEGFAIRVEKRKLRKEACRHIDEVRRLIIACRELDAPKLARGRYADLAFRCAFALLCGLRQGEIAGARWSSVDWRLSEPVFRVEYQACDGWRKERPDWLAPEDPPKDGIRDLVLHPNAVALLLELRELQRKFGLFREDGPIFPAHVPLKFGEGSQFRGHSKAIANKTEMKRAWTMAGLPNVARVSGHSLRHSTGTLEAAASGNDLTRVAERLGHASIRTSEIYIHSTERDNARSAIPLMRLGLGEGHKKDATIEDDGGIGQASGMGTVIIEDDGSIVLARPLVPSIADLCVVTPQYARDFEKKKREEKQRKHRDWREKHEGRVIGDFAGAFAEWTKGMDRAAIIAKIEAALGQKSVQHSRGRKEPIRPAAVTEMAEAARQRNKAEVKSKGGADVVAVALVAAKAGRDAHRGIVANWSKFLRRRLAELKELTAQQGESMAPK